MGDGAMGTNFLGDMVTGVGDIFQDSIGMVMRGIGAGVYGANAGAVQERGMAARHEGVSGIQETTEGTRQGRSYARGDYITDATTGATKPGESLVTATRQRDDVLATLRKDKTAVETQMGGAIGDAKQSGDEIVASVKDSLGLRIGALSRSLKNEQDLAFENINAEMLAGNLTPAAAAEMKEKVRLDGARRIGDEGALMSMAFAELKTQRMAENADLVASLESKLGELSTGFSLGGAEVGAVMGKDVLAAMASDRDFERSLYDVVIEEIDSNYRTDMAGHMATYGMTMDQIAMADRHGEVIAGMIAGIPPTDYAFDPGAAWSNAAAIMQQNAMAKASQPA